MSAPVSSVASLERNEQQREFERAAAELAGLIYQMPNPEVRKLIDLIRLAEQKVSFLNSGLFHDLLGARQ